MRGMPIRFKGYFPLYSLLKTRLGGRHPDRLKVDNDLWRQVRRLWRWEP